MKLPIVSGREMVKILDRKGWIMLSQRGSNVKMMNRVTGWRLSVPLHDDLKPGIINQCIKVAGLTDDDF